MSLSLSSSLLCENILSVNKNILSVAVVSKMGRVVEKASRPRFERQFPDCFNELFCMQSVLEISMGRDFEEKYGPINYHVSERSNLTTISFPFEGGIILVLLNKKTSPISLARKIVGLISQHGIIP